MNSKLPYNIIVTVMIVSILCLIQCGTDSDTGNLNSFSCGDNLTDIDGNNYQTVQIGGQCWMAENLRSSKYRNGIEIQNYTVEADWRITTLGAWVNYANNSSNNQVYGKLYNWSAVTDSRGICPEQWIIPDDEDWKELEMFVGMSQSTADELGWRGSEANAGGKLKSADTEFWRSPNEGATNESGFSGIPSGLRYPSGEFAFLGRSALFWTSTWFNIYEAYGRAIVNSREGISRGVYIKEFGLSVRCIHEMEPQ